MLVQEVVAKYKGAVSYANENFGASKLAERFGVTRYPAVFVNDVLVARPRDFGFLAEGEKSGRYTPWRNAESQERFKADLAKFIDLVLAGKSKELPGQSAGTGAAPDQIAALPGFSLTDLAGRPLTKEELAGRVVVVEFWATWCPPCRSTLEWLGTVKRRYGDRISILALAVESPEGETRKLAASLDPGVRWAIADAPTSRAFGDISAVPTMFLFDRSGHTSRVVYGAPPDLHEQIEGALDVLLKPE